MFGIVSAWTIEKSIKGVVLILIILIARQRLNKTSFRHASMILWFIFIAYLLCPYSISVDPREAGILSGVLTPIAYINKFLENIDQSANIWLTTINRLIVASFLIAYILYHVIKMNKLLMNSSIIEPDDRILDCIKSVDPKRKIIFLTNDEIGGAFTCGLFRPKIIIPRHVLNDNELLPFVLMHELMHVKKYDILIAHIKSLPACLYWFNLPLLFVMRYIEEDMEMLCDKRLIKEIGDNRMNRKQYCLSMFKLTKLAKATGEKKLALNFHPTVERINTIKKWKVTFSGVLLFVVVSGFMMTSFADVRIVDSHNIIVDTQGKQLSECYLNMDNKVVEITDKEYDELNLREAGIDAKAANINETFTLSVHQGRSYRVNTSNNTGANYEGLAIKVSDLSSYGSIEYYISIMENGEFIYKSAFSKAINLKFNADKKSNYIIYIQNLKAKPLRMNVKINTYVQ